ncbi:hypothetical protein AY601_1780 [Pedobacter cryoconitis]|uniref:Uncharacterized protein n=1 Tax=Pedobacter cryoconitis TaxID=188932 RepID=A0A127VBC1_9SPHI|nr:hypothetical protein [Pedobacter cryoconitis]AMP98692.1 hypothetical protein AY601_1780 [Pedobacter cryoconitis]
MAYSIIEQQTLDIDVFFKDRVKYIHVASAGGSLPKVISENDINNNAFSIFVESLPSLFEIEINPNLVDLIDLNPNDVDMYLADFVKMAKKGFYSYDKTQLGSFDNRFFHLVARPKGQNRLSIKNNINLLTIDNNLPDDFKQFNLFKFCKKGL